MDLQTAVNCVRALNAYGLSIWYPWDIAAKAAAYSQLALSRDSLWDEHLATYHSGKSLDVNLTAGLTLRDDDMNGAYDRGEIAFSSSQDGDVCIDMFRDLDLISSDIHAVSASVTYMRNVTFSSPGSYIIFLTFSQAGGTMNITWFPPIVVGTNITFRGIVRDAYGNNIAGAKVTMKNLRTGDEINATVDQAHYTFSVFYPVWMMNGDNLKLVATADGRSTTFEVKFEYIGSNLVWIDFYIPATNATDGEASLFGDYWPLVLIPIATLIMEIVLLALILRGEKTRRRRVK